MGDERGEDRADPSLDPDSIEATDATRAIMATEIRFVAMAIEAIGDQSPERRHATAEGIAFMLRAIRCLNVSKSRQRFEAIHRHRLRCVTRLTPNLASDDFSFAQMMEVEYSLDYQERLALNEAVWFKRWEELQTLTKQLLEPLDF